MSLAERRAWVGLLSLCPAYFVYFTILLRFPGWVTSFADRMGLLAIVATGHAVLAITGTIVFARRRRQDGLAEDERDRMIDRRATRIAYFILIAGMILVGCVLPFTKAEWQTVNAALLTIVIAEGLRQFLIIIGHRTSSFAF